MNKNNAIELFDHALKYSKENHPIEFEWASSINASTFKNMKSKMFLEHYCWVVYVSGFSVKSVYEIFPKLKSGFKEFDLEKLSRMRSTTSILRVFNNERKANCFLKGSKMIYKEGFSKFKKNLRANGIDMLENLPGIGKITKYHLAKNIGFADEAKPDVWLERAAEKCETTVSELVDFLSEKYQMTRHVVDVVLWRYGADKELKLEI